MARSKVGDSGLQIALDVIRRRKWIGLATFAAMLSLSAPFSVFLPDIYRGTATVIVESQEAPSNFVKPTVPELETRLLTIHQEILSRARLSELVKRFNLYPRLRAKVPEDAILERLRRDIRVDFAGSDESRGRGTTIGVKISYIGLDPKSAAAVPNALASLYVQENTRMRERQTGQMAQFLKAQLDKAGKEVARQEARLNEFKKLRAGELPEQVSINMVTLERLNTQLRLNNDNQLKVRDRQERFAGRFSGTAEPLDPLAMLKQRLVDLQSKFTESHPDVIRTKAQIAELERSRADESASGPPPASRPARPARSIDSELATLESEERTIRAQIAQYESRIQSAPRHEQELTSLERDYKSSKDSYDSLQARYEEAQLAENLEQTKKGETFRILDPAAVPTVPAAPNRIRLLFMALVFATALGAGVMLLTEHLDTSFHNVGELRHFTTIPVLATIPYVRAKADFAEQALRMGLFAGAVVIVCALLALGAYRAARENTQLVWMLAGTQL